MLYNVADVRLNRLGDSQVVVASYLFVFLQMQLLGAAVLHRHGETMARGSGTAVAPREVPLSANSDNNFSCVVCQIVHNGAFQPATAAQVLPPSATVPLLRLLAPNDHRWDSRAMTFGRAPPLV